jgi:hypothetical protein
LPGLPEQHVALRARRKSLGCLARFASSLPQSFIKGQDLSEPVSPDGHVRLPPVWGSRKRCAITDVGHLPRLGAGTNSHEAAKNKSKRSQSITAFIVPFRAVVQVPELQIGQLLLDVLLTSTTAPLAWTEHGRGPCVHLFEARTLMRFPNFDKAENTGLTGRAAVSAVAVMIGAAFAGSTLITPLYVIYKEQFAFPQVTLALVYGAYVLGNLVALLFFGHLMVGTTMAGMIATESTNMVWFAAAIGPCGLKMFMDALPCRNSNCDDALRFHSGGTRTCSQQIDRNRNPSNDKEFLLGHHSTKGGLHE